MDALKEKIIAGDDAGTAAFVRGLLDDKVEVDTIMKQGLIAAMDIVGSKMESGDMFIPEVLMCAKVMGEAVVFLKPHLSVEEFDDTGRVVIGTVKGDLHDIGKNLVAMMMQSGGFNVVNIGIDVPPQTFVEQIREHKPHVVALSALLTTTMPMMEKTIQLITENGLRSDVKIIVGGAPVNKAFAEKIGADGYAADAGSAVKLTKRLIQNR